MKKVRLPIMYAVVLISLFLLALPVVAKTGAKIEVLSWSWKQTELGYYQAVGELLNTGDRNAEFVECIVTWYSQSGEIVGTDFSYAMLDIIRPGEKSPFKVILLKAKGTPQKARLQWQWKETDEEPSRAIAVINKTGYFDYDLGYFKLNGEVKNQGNKPAKYVEIIATFYNKDGKVIDADFTYSSLDVISPGATSPFEVFVPDNNQEIKSYSLIAQTQ